MKSKLRKWIAMSVTILMIFAMPLTAHAFTYYIGPSKYTDITDVQYDAIYNTLKSMAEEGKQGSHEFRSTGVVCNTFEEAEAVMNAFEYLFPGFTSFFFVWNEYGANRITLTEYDSSTYHYLYYGNSRREKDIWVIWNPSVDTTEILSQNEQVLTEVKNIVDSSPEGTKEKLRYFYDVMKGRCSYDDEGFASGNYSVSSYEALIKGKAVCEGFSKAYLLLCKQAAIPCGIVQTDYSGEEKNHVYNIVYVDDHWLKVDVTYGITAKYCFLKEMSADMQEYYKENRIYGIQQ